MGIRSFAGKTVLLTGAASGIGRACAVELATAGAQLALVDIDAEGLGETAAAVRARGARAHTLVADLANEEAVEEWRRRCKVTWVRKPWPTIWPPDVEQDIQPARAKMASMRYASSS